MLIGVPRELQPDESRVALTPDGADVLVQAGHEVVASSDDVWKRATVVVRVKESVRSEWPKMHRGQVIFTYLHLAADGESTRACPTSRAVCIACETVELPTGGLPLLLAMSEIAGRMAVQEGAEHLAKPQGSRGVLLGGVPGVTPGKVVIPGGGVVGTNAAKRAAGLGTRVSIMDIGLPRLRYPDAALPKNVTWVFSTPQTIREGIADAEPVIGTVVRGGARTPHLFRRADLRKTKPGSVIVEVSLDQGGCAENIRPTTQHGPVYVVGNVLHYGVPKMPGARPPTSTSALAHATLPYTVALAGKARQKACVEDAAPELNVNAADGRLTHRRAAGAFGMPGVDVDTFLQTKRAA